jgi:DNA-binding NarL/FixJ family response regulator
MTAILVVEDHEIFAQALRRMLQERGHLEVKGVATSAEEALNSLSGQDIDLVLVDVSLPRRRGISLVLVIHERYPDLPCVMLSGHLSNYYAQRSLEAGARGYLVKDHADEILEGIQHVLNGEIYVSEELRDVR